jgi:hypothetical protein
VRDLAALWVLAFAASIAIGSHGILYWDAGDYVTQALTGQLSGLLLGRPLFLWMSRGVLAAGVDPLHAEPVLRWFWCAFGSLAAPALMVLARALGFARGPAFMAGVALALSPSFAHTSHQVLTDSPALALSMAGLAVAAAGSATYPRAIAAGALIAAAVAMRETAALQLVAVVLLLGWRGWASAAAFAVVLGGILAIATPPALVAWFSDMAKSADTHPWRWKDLAISAGWLMTAGPIPVIAGAEMLRRRLVNTRVLYVALPSAIATTLLFFYQDGSFSPRYMLATAPTAFFLAAAPWLARHPKLTAAALIVPFAIALVFVRPLNAVTARGATLTARLAHLPPRALVVPGHFCPQARLAATIHRRDDLEFVCPGWGWPADVGAVLDQAIASGQPVAVDPSPDVWMGGRETIASQEIQNWLAKRAGRTIADFVVIDRPR